jgi:O-antigen/teichoic acid export membrane protein
MPQHRRYVLSAATNWAAFAATLLVAFFLSPYLVRTLGDGRYGVWVFVESILAYFTLFDLGIAACVVRFVARHHAAGEHDQLNRLVSSCLALFLALGALAFLAGLALTPVVAPLMAKSGMDPAEITGFMLLMLGNLALSLPLSVFPSVLDGLERFAAKSAVRIGALAFRTAATVALMETRPGLLGLGLIFTVGNLAEHLVLALLCKRHLPGLRFARKYIDRATLRLVRGYSVDAFLALIAGRVAVQSGTVVIGICLSAPEVTWFAIALRLVEFAKALLRSATTTLTPAVSALEAAGDVAAIRGVLLNGTRWALYLIVPVHLGLVIFGRPFLAVWMGSPEYADRCYPALAVLSATLSLVVAQSVAARILYGTGRLRLFARVALLEALINLALSILLVRSLGIIGVAWAAAVPNFVMCLFVIGYTCRTYGLAPRTYLAGSWTKPLLAGLVPLAVWLAGWEVKGWLSFALAIGAGLVPYALVVALAEGKAFGGVRRAFWRAVPAFRGPSRRGR